MFEQLSHLPSDPILGLMAKFKQDPNPNKIDLGVGVYKDENGNTPVLDCVKHAEQFILQNENSKAYIGPFGNQDFNSLMASLYFGENAQALKDKRFSIMQTPGGCGALYLIARILLSARPETSVWVSDPTWGNHMPLLGGAGVSIKTYPYYDYANHCVNFEKMIDTIKRIPQGDAVLLHACCHNPCGADLSVEQWREVVSVINQRGLLPIVDCAYLGFGESLAKDSYGLQLVTQLCPEALFAISCSKNFGLYRERVGVIAVLSETERVAQASASHLASITRGVYSMPPSHGAAIVQAILASPELRQTWEKELDSMRVRISQMRSKFVEEMTEAGFAECFGFIVGERGMFSFLGVNAEQVNRLAAESSIYMVDSGRINVAGLNGENIFYFCEAIQRLYRGIKG